MNGKTGSRGWLSSTMGQHCRLDGLEAGQSGGCPNQINMAG